MDTINLFLYLAILIITYLIFNNKIRSKLNNLPPSPFLCFPIIGHLYLFKKPLHRSLDRVSNRYGPIIYLRFGARPVVVLSSPESVEEGLIRNDVFLDRPKLLPGKYGGYNYTSLAWSPYGPHWKNLRRISAVEILSSQRLQVLSPIRSAVARAFIARVLNECRSNENGYVEMKSSIFALTLDNMMRMLVGSSNFEKGNEESEESKRFQEIMEESFRLGGVSNLEDFLPIMKLFRRFVGSAEAVLKMLKEKKDVFMEGLMKEHRELEKEGKLSEDRKRSMLHVLLCLQKDDPKYYSDEFIRSLILSLFQGGTDTSAGTTVWAVTLLLNHPEVLAKAQAEIDANIGNNRLVEESDKAKIPYIQCIVNETFRMYPTGPLGLPRESRADCKIGGYHVPKGSMLLYNIWAIHNDPNIWAEPRVFRPERFVGLETNRSGSKFMPFGTGRRACPGEHLAGRMVWLAVATLVQCFDWKRVSDELVDIEEGGGLSLAKLNPLRIKCRPRPCMMNVLSQL